MTWQVLITVFTLGGLGAMVRGSITMILASSARIFPMSILIVNLLAAFLGGFLLKLNLPEGLNAAIAIGLIGGIGTLSSIHGNLLDLFFDKAYRRLALYLGLTIFGGVLGAQAGMSIGNFTLNLVQGPQQLQNQMMLESLQQQEFYLDSLKSGDHIDYEHLPQLSPLPENEVKESTTEDATSTSEPNQSDLNNSALSTEALEQLKKNQELIEAFKRQEQTLEQLNVTTDSQEGQESEETSTPNEAMPLEEAGSADDANETDETQASQQQSLETNEQEQGV